MFKKFLFLGIIIIFFAACEEVIDVDLNYSDERLVIEGQLNWIKETQQTEQIIKLSKTTPYFETLRIPANGAEVQVYDDENNIFAKILRKEIPCDKIYEDEFSLFFNDINPQAKIHILGIPKFPCTTFSDFLKNADNENITSFFKSVQFVINNINIENTGYRLITNSGEDGGQEVPHFHIHILAGEKIGSLR